MTEAWASGRWQVKEGAADEFVQCWEAWLTATATGVPGFRSARLLRSQDDPNVFTSVSDWDDDTSLKAWKVSEGFTAGLTSARELCDDFMGGDFDVAVAVNPSQG
jgi:heme-degrading monooxygenase HmoA